MKADNLLNWEKRELAELLADKYADESLLIEAFPSIDKASCLESSWIQDYIEKNWQVILYDYDIAELGEWIDDVELMESIETIEDEIRTYNIIEEEEYAQALDEMHWLSVLDAIDQFRNLDTIDRVHPSKYRKS